MENINLHILSGDIRMARHESTIREAADAILPAAASAISAHNIDIVVGIDAKCVILETGVGGSTQSPHLVFVWIDPSHTNVQTNLTSTIQSTIVHELHHVMRSRTHPWPGTLLDDIVGEGLADHFDMEITGSEPPQWAHALSDEQLEEMYTRAEPLFHTKGNGYSNWMFGSPEESIPQWTGYALGFKIVDDYIKHTGKKASELVDTPTAELII